MLLEHECLSFGVLVPSAPRPSPPPPRPCRHLPALILLPISTYATFSNSVTRFLRCGASHLPAIRLGIFGANVFEFINQLKKITRPRTPPANRVLRDQLNSKTLSETLSTQAAGATVIAAASTPEKLETCRDSGADFLLNYRDPKDSRAGKSRAGNWRQALKRLVGPRGIDVVLDSVGGADCEVMHWHLCDYSLPYSCMLCFFQIFIRGIIAVSISVIVVVAVRV